MHNALDDTMSVEAQAPFHRPRAKEPNKSKQLDSYMQNKASDGKEQSDRSTLDSMSTMQLGDSTASSSLPSSGGTGKKNISRQDSTSQEASSKMYDSSASGDKSESASNSKNESSESPLDDNVMAVDKDVTLPIPELHNDNMSMLMENRKHSLRAPSVAATVGSPPQSTRGRFSRTRTGSHGSIDAPSTGVPYSTFNAMDVDDTQTIVDSEDVSPLLKTFMNSNNNNNAQDPSVPVMTLGTTPESLERLPASISRMDEDDKNSKEETNSAEGSNSKAGSNSKEGSSSGEGSGSMPVGSGSQSLSVTRSATGSNGSGNVAGTTHKRLHNLEDWIAQGLGSRIPNNSKLVDSSSEDNQGRDPGASQRSSSDQHSSSDHKVKETDNKSPHIQDDDGMSSNKNTDPSSPAGMESMKRSVSEENPAPLDHATRDIQKDGSNAMMKSDSDELVTAPQGSMPETQDSSSSQQLKATRQLRLQAEVQAAQAQAIATEAQNQADFAQAEAHAAAVIEERTLDALRPTDRTHRKSDVDLSLVEDELANDRSQLVASRQGTHNAVLSLAESTHASTSQKSCPFSLSQNPLDAVTPSFLKQAVKDQAPSICIKNVGEESYVNWRSKCWAQLTSDYLYVREKYDPVEQTLLLSFQRPTSRHDAFIWFFRDVIDRVWPYAWATLDADAESAISLSSRHPEVTRKPDFCLIPRGESRPSLVVEIVYNDPPEARGICVRPWLASSQHKPCTIILVEISEQKRNSHGSSSNSRSPDGSDGVDNARAKAVDSPLVGEIDCVISIIRTSHDVPVEQFTVCTVDSPLQGYYEGRSINLSVSDLIGGYAEKVPDLNLGGLLCVPISSFCLLLREAATADESVNLEQHVEQALARWSQVV